MDMTALARRLRALRAEQCYTQEALARQLHVSRQAVSKWETGVSAPSMDILLALSRLYGLTVNQLAEPEGPSLITNFEGLTGLSVQDCQTRLSGLDTTTLALACMGASPGAYALLTSACPQIELQEELQALGQARIEEVEAAQARVVAWVNRSPIKAPL